MRLDSQGDDMILNSLQGSRKLLVEAVRRLDEAVELIGEYELWRIIRSEVWDVREETCILGRRVGGLVELIDEDLVARELIHAGAQLSSGLEGIDRFGK